LSSAKKLVLMKEGALVEFLNEEKKDSSGVKWIKIRTKDGATGWANAEWLGEVL
jgi:SH3-like domain-containing protein